MMNLVRKAMAVLIELDLIIFVVTVLATGFVNIILGPYQTIRPFYPHDARLWQLNTGDTIHTGVVFVILYFILTPILYVAEKHTLRVTTALPSARIHHYALRLALGVLSCTMISILIIESGKGYVGALRPSFARKCLGPAEPPYIPGNPLHPGREDATIRAVYTSDAQCPTPDRRALHDARRSFPSGHASLAVSGGVYGLLVLTRLARDGLADDVQALGAYAFGWAWLFFAAWVSASRVYDSAHHVADVAVGALVGACCGAVHFWYALGRNERAQQREPVETSEKAQ